MQDATRYRAALCSSEARVASVALTYLHK